MKRKTLGFKALGVLALVTAALAVAACPQATSYGDPGEIAERINGTANAVPLIDKIVTGAGTVDDFNKLAAEGIGYTAAVIAAEVVEVNEYILADTTWASYRNTWNGYTDAQRGSGIATFAGYIQTAVNTGKAVKLIPDLIAGTGTQAQFNELAALHAGSNGIGYTFNANIEADWLADINGWLTDPTNATYVTYKANWTNGAAFDTNVEKMGQLNTYVAYISNAAIAGRNIYQVNKLITGDGAKADWLLAYQNTSLPNLSADSTYAPDSLIADVNALIKATGTDNPFTGYRVTWNGYTYVQKATNANGFASYLNSAYNSRAAQIAAPLLGDLLAGNGTRAKWDAFAAIAGVGSYTGSIDAWTSSGVAGDYIDLVNTLLQDAAYRTTEKASWTAYSDEQKVANFGTFTVYLDTAWGSINDLRAAKLIDTLIAGTGTAADYNKLDAIGSGLINVNTNINPDIVAGVNAYITASYGAHKTAWDALSVDGKRLAVTTYVTLIDSAISFKADPSAQAVPLITVILTGTGTQADFDALKALNVGFTADVTPVFAALNAFIQDDTYLASIRTGWNTSPKLSGDVNNYADQLQNLVNNAKAAALWPTFLADGRSAQTYADLAALGIGSAADAAFLAANPAYLATTNDWIDDTTNPTWRATTFGYRYTWDQITDTQTTYGPSAEGSQAKKRIAYINSGSLSSAVSNAVLTGKRITLIPTLIAGTGTRADWYLFNSSNATQADIDLVNAYIANGANTVSGGTPTWGDVRGSGIYGWGYTSGTPSALVAKGSSIGTFQGYLSSAYNLRNGLKATPIITRLINGTNTGAAYRADWDALKAIYSGSLGNYTGSFTNAEYDLVKAYIADPTALADGSSLLWGGDSTHGVRTSTTNGWGVGSAYDTPYEQANGASTFVSYLNNAWGLTLRDNYKKVNLITGILNGSANGKAKWDELYNLISFGPSNIPLAVINEANAVIAEGARDADSVGYWGSLTWTDVKGATVDGWNYTDGGTAPSSLTAWRISQISTFVDGSSGYLDNAKSYGYYKIIVSKINTLLSSPGSVAAWNDLNTILTSQSLPLYSGTFDAAKVAAVTAYITTNKSTSSSGTSGYYSAGGWADYDAANHGYIWFWTTSTELDIEEEKFAALVDYIGYLQAAVGAAL
ncbi:hypothetical protein FACS189483_05720 [Spirochaetia bacterium]|nr:hypothetical protein FACS189483_05720 [Spirochaetia bacterium]